MEQNELQILLSLRKYLINKYTNLDGRSNPSSAVMLQKDVAVIIEESIRRLDVAISGHVKIGK